MEEGSGSFSRGGEFGEVRFASSAKKGDWENRSGREISQS